MFPFFLPFLTVVIIFLRDLHLIALLPQLLSFLDDFIITFPLSFVPISCIPSFPNRALTSFFLPFVILAFTNGTGLRKNVFSLAASLGTGPRMSACRPVWAQDPERMHVGQFGHRTQRGCMKTSLGTGPRRSACRPFWAQDLEGMHVGQFGHRT